MRWYCVDDSIDEGEHYVSTQPCPFCHGTRDDGGGGGGKGQLEDICRIHTAHVFAVIRVHTEGTNTK